MAYHHFGDKRGFAREAARVLKPNGALYVADPRFPWAVRKTLNGILRLIRVTGEFLAPQEIEARFAAYGFTGAGSAADTYAQVVKLQLNNRIKENHHALHPSQPH
jgi:SAM-dependent methyltransferase